MEIIVLLLFVAIGVMLLKAQKKNQRPQTAQQKGIAGEREVQAILKKLGKKYKVYNDLYLPKGKDQLTQVDHIVLSPYGIFVIETKNFAGWIYGQEQDYQWTQVLYKKKSPFYNPILQNKGHVEALERALGVRGVQSVVVFSNKATLKHTQPFQQASVLNMKELAAYFQQFTAEQYSKVELAQLVEKMSAYNVSSSKKGQQRSAHLAQLQFAASGQTCPKCGAALRRKTKDGQGFYSCSNASKCRYTERIRES